jgi:hypothetical protein
MINPIQWAVRKGKGHICINCANGPNGPGTNSSTNTYIPRPKDNDMDLCPLVYCATAFLRHLQHLWQTPIKFLLADILQHCDNIDATFSRVLYNPELAKVFAYVFGLFLLILVGQAFGTGLLALSYFSLMSEIRIYVSTSADLIVGYPMQPLALVTKLLPAPQLMDLAPVIAGSGNIPLSHLKAASPSNTTLWMTRAC